VIWMRMEGRGRYRMYVSEMALINLAQWHASLVRHTYET